MSHKLLDLINISKSYDDQLILDDMNLYIRENEFLTLLGPSGCGKTTTLRIIGGFETPDIGRVMFDGKDITNVPPKQTRTEHCVSEIRTLHPHDYRGKHCVRPENQGQIESLHRRQDQVRTETCEPGRL